MGILQNTGPSLSSAVLIPSFEHLNGMSLIMFHAPVLFRTLGLGDDAFLMASLITGPINVSAHWC